eukprot:403374201
MNSANGRVKWHRQITTQTSDIIQPSSIKYCGVQDTSRYYVYAVTRIPQYSYIILNYSTGNLSRLIYINVYAFDPTSTTITPTFSKSYGSVLNQEVGICSFILYSKNYLLTGGQHNGDPAVIVMDLTNLSPVADVHFSASNNNADQRISQITAYLKTNGRIDVLAYGQYFGTSLQDVALIYLQESVILGSSSINLVKSWYITQTVQTDCRALSLDSQYGGFVISQQSTGLLRFGRIDITGSSTSVSLRQLQITLTNTQFLSYDAQLLNSATELFYIGYTYQIESTVYIKQQGFIMRYPQTPACVNITQPVSTITAAYQSSFLLGNLNSASTIIFTTTSQSFQIREITGAATVNLLLIDNQNIPEVCTAYYNQGTINPPSLSDQTYTVNDALLEYSFSDFTYSTNCYDQKQWTYTATLTDGSSLPSHITFIQLSSGNGMKFTFIIYFRASDIAFNYNYNHNNDYYKYYYNDYYYNDYNDYYLNYYHTCCYYSC